MPIVRFTEAELIASRLNPLPWWSKNPRWKNGRVAPGVPIPEMDDESPTGWYLMAHRDIDTWDNYTLDVMRAGWQYTKDHPDGAALIQLQQAVDWDEWDRIEYANEIGLLDADTTAARIAAYLVSLGRSLGVPDPVDEEGNPLVSPDPIVLSDLPARPG